MTKKYPCPDCPQGFDQLWQLENHRMDVHAGQPSLSADKSLDDLRGMRETFRKPL